MSINIGDKPEMNVVNVGEEISQAKLDAINFTAASGTNVFMTQQATFNAYAGKFEANTFTQPQTITQGTSSNTALLVTHNGSGDAVRITQTGGGNALVVEDSANPDSTPFIINTSGKVGVGVSSASLGIMPFQFNVSGSSYFAGQITTNNSFYNNAGTEVTGTAIKVDNAGSGMSLEINHNNTVSSSPAVSIYNQGTSNSLVVGDAALDSTPFVIDANGSVGIKKNTPSYDLDVNGTVNLTTLRFSNGTTQSTAATSPDLSGYALKDSSNTFTATQSVSVTGQFTSGLSVGSSGFTPAASITNNGNGAGLSALASSGAAGQFTNSGSGLAASFINNSTGPVATFESNNLSSSTAVTITNNGTGNSFVVNDIAGDTSPFVIDADGNVAIGATSVGVGSPKLRVEGHLSVNANTSVNAFNLSQIGVGTIASFVNTSSATSDAVRITNLGTGHSLLVEDASNPDSTPFVITADGRVGIGTTTVSTNALTVSGTTSLSGNTSVTGTLGVSSTLTASAGLAANNACTITLLSGSAVPLTIQNNGTGNSFVVNDVASDTTPFVIDNAGNVTLGGDLTLSSGAYSASTALGTVTPDYPHELTFKVGSTTYRVPARAI